MNNTIKHDVKYEYGAFFKYIDLYKALCDLIPILSTERIGNNGVYFQRNETEEKKLSKNNSDYEKSVRLKISSPIRSIYYNNYPMILNKDKGRAKKILLPSFTSPIKYFPNFHLPQKSNFINFVNTLKQKQEINKDDSCFSNKDSSEKSGRNNDIFMKRNYSNFSFPDNKDKYYKHFFYDENLYKSRLKHSKNKKLQNSSPNHLFPIFSDSEKTKIKITKDFRKKIHNLKITKTKNKIKMLFNRNQDKNLPVIINKN